MGGGGGGGAGGGLATEGEPGFEECIHQAPSVCRAARIPPDSPAIKTQNGGSLVSLEGGVGGGGGELVSRAVGVAWSLTF